MRGLGRFKLHVGFLDDSDDACWIWMGALRDDGLGRTFVRGREERAHRVAWEFLNGRRLRRGVRLVRVCAQPQCIRHWRLERTPRKRRRKLGRTDLAGDNESGSLCA